MFDFVFVQVGLGLIVALLVLQDLQDMHEKIHEKQIHNQQPKIVLKSVLLYYLIMLGNPLNAFQGGEWYS